MRSEPEAGGNARAVGVAEAIAAINARLDAPGLCDLRVRGELVNWKVGPAGHAYFTLKDEAGRAALDAVIFRGDLAFVTARKYRPADGDRIVVTGAVRVYPERGRLQLYARAIEQDAGTGDLFRRYLELKQKLREEGLFDAANKPPLPADPARAMPRRVGVVTSPTGAVIRDILTVSGRRSPAVPILLSPCRVQGQGAAEEIARAIEALRHVADLDVIIVARGGGSLEDLWAFNEERVARAIAASRVPVVSAVGHETDETIADFVATRRAPTPSAAAEIVFPDRAAQRETLDRLAGRLERAIGARAERLETLLDRLARLFRTDRFRREVELRGEGLDDLAGRLTAAARRIVPAERARLAAFPASRLSRALEASLAHRAGRLDPVRARLERAARSALERAAGAAEAGRRSLDALDPRAVLARGYAVVRGKDGRALTDAAAVREGSTVDVELHRGGLTAWVAKTRPAKADAARKENGHGEA